MSGMNYSRCESTRRTLRGINDEALVAPAVRRMEDATRAYLEGGHATDDKVRAKRIVLMYSGADGYLLSVQTQAITKGEHWLPSAAQTRVVLDKAAGGRLD